MIVSPYDVIEVTKRRAKEAEDRAQIRRLIGEAGVDHRAWLSRRVDPLLHQAGCLLVAAGRQLQRLGSPRPVRSGDGAPPTATIRS